MKLNDIGLELDSQGSAYWTVRIIGDTDSLFVIDRDQDWQFTYKNTTYKLTAAPWGDDTIKVIKVKLFN